MQADDGPGTAELTDSGIGISQVRSLPGLDITGWAASLLPFQADLPAMEEATSSWGEM